MARFRGRQVETRGISKILYVFLHFPLPPTHYADRRRLCRRPFRSPTPQVVTWGSGLSLREVFRPLFNDTCHVTFFGGRPNSALLGPKGPRHDLSPLGCEPRPLAISQEPTSISRSGLETDFEISFPFLIPLIYLRSQDVVWRPISRFRFHFCFHLFIFDPKT